MLGLSSFNCRACLEAKPSFLYSLPILLWQLRTKLCPSCALTSGKQRFPPSVPLLSWNEHVTTKWHRKEGVPTILHQTIYDYWWATPDVEQQYRLCGLLVLLVNVAKCVPCRCLKKLSPPQKHCYMSSIKKGKKFWLWLLEEPYLIKYACFIIYISKCFTCCW